MTDRVLTARHYATGRWIRVECDGPLIATVESTGEIGIASDEDPWIAPAFWDLQVNGRWGVSFSDATITPEQVERIAQAQSQMGTARFCPTLITAGQESSIAGLRAIDQACKANPLVDHQILGIHLEGPWISPEEGYRGAHPRDHVRRPDWEEFQALQEASGNRIILVTLAPECEGVTAMIPRLRKAGVHVAIGHSAADSSVIDEALAAGVTMATHLGNGLPAILPRHPNPIWELASRRKLWTSFIADGNHLDWATLRVLLQARPDRSFVVSDASPLAGSTPGLYGPWEVREDGRIVVAGTPYLAGSNYSLMDAVNNLTRLIPMSRQRAFDLVSSKAARALGMRAPRLEPGYPSDLVLFRCCSSESYDVSQPTLELLATAVLDQWSFPEPSTETAAESD